MRKKCHLCCHTHLDTSVSRSFVRGTNVVYYESLKRELKTKKIDGYRCDERLIKLT
jgi:hypothetical protein